VIDSNISHQVEEARRVVRSDPQSAVLLSQQLISSDLPSVQERIELLLVNSRAHIHLGQYDLGRPMAEQALVLSRGTGDLTLEARSHNELGIYHFVHHEFTDALQHYEAAERLLLDLGDTAEVARVYVNVANVYQIMQEAHDSITMYERALDLARKVDDKLTQAKVLVNLAGMYRTVVYDPDTSFECMTAAEELYRELGDKVGIAKSLVSLGIHYLADGDYERSLALLEEGLSMRAHGAEPNELLLNYDGIISALIKLGRVDDARRRHREILDRFSTHLNDPSLSGWIKASTVRMLLAEGNVDEALPLWSEVQEWLLARGVENTLVDIEEILAEELAGRGEYEESYRLLRSILNKRSTIARERAEARLSWFKARLDLKQAQSEAEIERIRNVELASAVGRLEELHRENDQYVAFLAHELKSPLNTIRAISAMLGTDAEVRDNERMDFAREINRISSRMFDLINQTLEVSKHRLYRAGSLTNARTVWDHVIATMKAIAIAKKIDVVCLCDSAQYLVVSAEQPLVTIMENLLSNALKYSGEGSTVTVETRLKGSPARSWFVHLSVTDHGPGLSSDDKAKLFRPFETLTARPTQREDSTGLGLHLVQRTVAMLGGRIWCESDLGQGATFHVELPLHVDEG